MQCPWCGAICGPGVSTSCDVCGKPFDLDATGVVAAGTALVDAGVTRLANASSIRHSAASIDLDLTGAGAPAAVMMAASARTSVLEPGGNVGDRYHIIKLLGMGGMGAVYQAWDAELEVALALKVIRPDTTGDPDTAADIERRFKRELLLARQVTHPNVVRIHDLGEFDGIKYITMPYIQGTDLANVLAERGTLPVPEALHVATQIAGGLAAAHAAGVVHRDLKPANIMIDANRRALIADFGIARGSTLPEPPAPGAPVAFRQSSLTGPADVTRLGMVMGSLEYMAPEQARGEAVDHRADIYAFGLILTRMLVGKPPPTGAAGTLAELQERKNAAPRPLREIDPSIPEAVDRIVTRCLQPNRDARFPTTADLVAALNRLDANGVPLPLPVQLLKSLRFWSAAAIAAIAIAAGTWLVTDRPAPPAPDPVAVIVADVANHTAEPVFDGLLEQALTVGIEGASFITALPRDSAVRTARLIKAGNRLDEPTARLVALREGVKVVLLGAIDKRGNGYRLSVQGVDPSSRKVLFTSSADARDRDGVLRVGATLAARVRSALGDSRAVDPKETLSTASLEAASAYTRAQELSAAGKDQDAIPFFRQAVALDSGFGRAYGGLAMSVTRLGRRDEAAELWQKALKYTDVMSEREKYRLLGAYYTSVTRNFATAAATYEALVQQYPADSAGHNNLAVAYFRGLQFAKALKEGGMVRQIYPNNPLYRSNYALYAMYAGDFSLAAKEAQKLVDEGLAPYDTYLPLAVTALANGNRDAALDAYARMAKRDDAGASLAATGIADLGLSEGRAADAIAVLQAAIKTDQAQQNPAGVAIKEIVLADALGMQGNVAAAAAAARRALAIDRTESQILPAARWMIAARQADEAARLGEELDRRLELQARAYGRIVAAQVARARGKNVEAIDALRAALKLADLWTVHLNLGQAYLEAGAPAEAFSEFETCLKRRGEGYAAFLDDVPTARAMTPVRYWIARAHEGMGLTPQAVAEYQAFAASYAADSPDPLLKDARTRLKTLR